MDNFMIYCGVFLYYLIQVKAPPGNDGIIYTFEWPLQIFNPGSEGDRLTNRCTSYTNKDCGAAATLISATGAIPNQIIGDYLPGNGNQGFQVNSDDIFYGAVDPPGTGEITMYVLEMSYKIKSFGTGDIYLQKADPNLKVGNVWCKDGTNKLWISYNTAESGLIKYETAYTCIIGKWSNLIFSVSKWMNDPKKLKHKFVADIAVRSIDDPDKELNHETTGPEETLALPGSTNKIIEFGSNFNGNIHSIRLTVGESEGGDKLSNWESEKKSFEKCKGKGAETCALHKMACIGFTDKYPDNQCILSETDFNYCSGTDFDPIIGCTSCPSPTTLGTGSPAECVCAIQEFGATPNKACGCGWKCDNCADSTTCNTCIVQANVNTTVPCNCNNGFWNDGSTCTSCGWKCETCADASTCATCITDTNVNATVPCECNSGFWDTGAACTSCGWKCETCADALTCATCMTDTNVNATVPCECNSGFWDTGAACTSCGWKCETCADASTCATCITDTNVNATVPCECKFGFLDDGAACTKLECGWSCEACVNTTTCSQCIVQTGVATNPPCGCDTTNHFQEFPAETCECDDGYKLNLNICLMKCAWNCVLCSEETACITCKTDIIGLETEVPCSCNNSAGYAEIIPESCTECQANEIASGKECIVKEPMIEEEVEVDHDDEYKFDWLPIIIASGVVVFIILFVVIVFCKCYSPRAATGLMTKVNPNFPLAHSKITVTKFTDSTTRILEPNKFSPSK